MEVAARNRDKLRGKKDISRGRFIVNAMERLEIEKLETKDPWRKATWKPGAYLEVEHAGSATDTPERIVGVLIGIYRRGLGSSFRLLCYIENTAVEYLFQTYSPLVTSITVRRESTWRNNKRKLVKLRDVVNQLKFPKPSRPTKRVEAQTATFNSGRKAGGPRS